MPTMNVAAYQIKQYETPRCWGLVTDVYQNVLSADPLHVRSITESMRHASRAFRLRLHKDDIGLLQITEPRDFAVVLMWPTAKRRHPHCGIFYDGKVLHATEAATLYQDLASLGDAYEVMEYWSL